MHIGHRQQKTADIDPVVCDVLLIEMIEVKYAYDIIGRVLKYGQPRICGIKYLFNVFLVRVVDINRFHINPRGDDLVRQHRVKIKRVLEKVALLLVKDTLVLHYVDYILKIVL